MVARLWELYFNQSAKLARRMSLIGVGPVWRRDELPWLDKFESAYAAIRDEIVAYLASGRCMPDKEDLDPGRTSQYGTDRWEILHLMVYGEMMPSVADSFPRTMEIAKQVPGVCSVMFSRLPPERRHIPAHRDAENGSLRMHFALVVPPGKCFIRVADQLAHWREGEAFVIDAAFEHEVTKEADRERIILIVDFYRPVPRWVALLTHRLYARHGGKIAKRVLRNSYQRLLRQL